MGTFLEKIQQLVASFKATTATVVRFFRSHAIASISVFTVASILLVIWARLGFSFDVSRFFASEPAVLSVQCGPTQNILTWTLPAGRDSNAIIKRISTSDQGFYACGGPNLIAPCTNLNVTTFTDTDVRPDLTYVYFHKSGSQGTSNIVTCAPASTPTPTPPVTGSISVSANIQTAPWCISGAGCGAGNSSATGLPFGTYTITMQAIAGYTCTPDAGSKTIGPSSPAATFVLTCTQNPVVTPTATPEPALPTFDETVNGTRVRARISALLPRALLDGNTTTQAWHTDTAGPTGTGTGNGAYILLNPPSAAAFTGVKIYASLAGYRGIYDIKYSDDGAAYTKVGSIAPSVQGWTETTWAGVGSHTYWALFLTNTPGPGSWLNELQFVSPTSTPTPTPTPAPLVCAPLVQTATSGQMFSITATGGAGSYQWTYGNGQVSSGPTLTTSLTTVGLNNFSVSAGAQATSCQVIVQQPPVAHGVLAVSMTGRNTSTSGVEGASVAVSTGQQVQVFLHIRNTSSAAGLSGVIARVILPTGLVYVSGSTIVNSVPTVANSIVTGGLAVGSIAPNQETIVALRASVNTSQFAIGTTPVQVTTQLQAADVPGASGALTVSVTKLGTVAPVTVSTGPGDALLAAFLISSIMTLLYVSYTHTSTYKRREVSTITKDSDPLDFRS